ncbi:nuclear hormone receptor HR96-like isoform X3 [Mya arenaria]|uniref:nuclear hormone receptor HR96-like isoform X3 n=2 Tax=Mya arenaria TaxID=6604 RepID=UPI0022E54B07|nr:nuclear hormone receptor HR96-like isoform X3 [Mya arenaria]XP_052770341.1 nuclear hormone receptor HR96-like isoform X3 [Mya arenaria]XP_052770343.1 nuclear hormone receptor HR96-like isoform X3 [Mya arenaria]
MYTCVQSGMDKLQIPQPGPSTADPSILDLADEKLDLDGSVYLCEQTLKMTSLGFEDSNSNGYSEGIPNPYRPMDLRPDYNGMEPLHKSRKNKEDKFCGVCGDRALGYNFDAISCESCKAFFRRNAPKGLDYFKCPYEEKCKMDVSNRRFCKRCRLRKCFEIGMRKEYILTDEEKMRKRQRIDDNRRMRDLEKSMAQSGVVSPNLGGMSPAKLRSLEPEEEAAINEIVRAYRASLEIPIESKVPRDNANFAALVNIAEVSVRRVVDMAKKLKAFKALSQTDQIGLLKGGSIELLILRSVISFDKENNYFLDPYDKDSLALTQDQFKEGIEKSDMGMPGMNIPGGPTGLFDDHMKFVKSLAIDLKADETMLILLLMLSLFSPDRPNVTDKVYISAEQDKYALLLQRYLESRYPYQVARSVFPRLLMKLTDIRNLNEEHSQVLLKLNPEGLQPLMKEVMDLHLKKKGTDTDTDSDASSSIASP